VGREDVINRKQNLFPHIVRGEGKKIVLFFLPTTQQKSNQQRKKWHIKLSGKE